MIAPLIFATLSLLYWAGLCPSFGPGDSPQHALSALTWGVPVAPGYPLQVMLGYWSARLSGGGLSAVAALSAVFHAGAAALFYLLLKRQGLKPLPAMAATAFMALSRLFWYYAEIPEVRALNDFLAVGAAWAAAAWAQERKISRLWLLAAALGFGLTHHPTFVLILPAIAYWLWHEAALPRRGRAGGALLLMIFCAILPYLVLKARLDHSPPLYNPDEVQGWKGVLALAMRQRVGGLFRMVSGTGVMGFGRFDPERFLKHSGWFLSAAFWELSCSGVVLAGIGAAAAFAKNRRILAFWGAWLFFTAFCFILLSSQQMALCDEAYLRGLVMRFYLLPLIALFALAGFGIEALAEKVRPGFIWTLLGALVFVPAALRPMDLRRHELLKDYAELILKNSGPEDVVILAADDSIFALRYLELVEHKTGKRIFLTPSLFSYPAYIRQLQRRHPELHVPPLGPEGLSTDWGLWQKLNPGKSFYGEAVLREVLLAKWPKSRPRGPLVQISSREPARLESLLGAYRLLQSKAFQNYMDQGIFDFTQEAYLRQSYRSILEWYATFLRPEDAELSLRIHLALSAIR
ncbi:MAG: DUF2723 domain-containing protein [Elusimicrobia bacterium]|nr:DUF2723 domain-containing protein [Elusimicrobiota bacterium]